MLIYKLESQPEYFRSYKMHIAYCSQYVHSLVLLFTHMYFFARAPTRRSLVGFLLHIMG